MKNQKCFSIGENNGMSLFRDENISNLSFFISHYPKGIVYQSNLCRVQVLWDSSNRLLTNHLGNQRLGFHRGGVNPLRGCHEPT